MTTETEAVAQPWTANDRTFGARLALIRQHQGWGNVKEAAVACGLPPESWRTWERDNVTPRAIVTVAKQIAGRVGCEYLWLLVGPDWRNGALLAGISQQRLIKVIGEPNGQTAPAVGRGKTDRPVRLSPQQESRTIRPLTPCTT